jgi:5-methylcytosine rRNA methyltransferase NSUN4
LYCLKHPREFDRVLVDAPCSGERHLLMGGDELKNWTPSRSKQLSVRQHSLLCAALDATKDGGTVVYSTCALSPLENDGVIRKLLKSRKDQFTVVKSSDSAGEATEFGRIYLPDVSGGSGPIYCAVLKR